MELTDNEHLNQLEAGAQNERTTNGTDHKTFVSRSGTIHIIGRSGSILHGRRIAALCQFSIQPEDGPYEPTRECDFCLAVLKEKDGARVGALETAQNYSIDDEPEDHIPRMKDPAVNETTI